MCVLETLRFCGADDPGTHTQGSGTLPRSLPTAPQLQPAVLLPSAGDGGHTPSLPPLSPASQSAPPSPPFSSPPAEQVVWQRERFPSAAQGGLLRPPLSPLSPRAPPAAVPGRVPGSPGGGCREGGCRRCPPLLPVIAMHSAMPGFPPPP